MIRTGTALVPVFKAQGINPQETRTRTSAPILEQVQGQNAADEDGEPPQSVEDILAQAAVTFDGSQIRDAIDAALPALAAPSRDSASPSVAAQPLSPAHETLRLWMTKTLLRFGFEKDPKETGPALRLLKDPGIWADWGTHQLGPHETLTISKPTRSEIELEFVRQSGGQATIIHASYDGNGRYAMAVEFPQMSERMVMTHDKTSESRTRRMTEARFARELLDRERLGTIDALADRQASEAGFRAWEHIADKHGTLPQFAPRAELLGEIMMTELFHLKDTGGLQDRGRTRVDIVYGYLGETLLGESEPIDYTQSRRVFAKLVKSGFMPRKRELIQDNKPQGDISGEVLAKTISYKGKPVEITVRLTYSAVPNRPLTQKIQRVLDTALANPRQKGAVLAKILKKGKASPSMIGMGPLASYAADRINEFIDDFQRRQASQSFKAKRAFEDALAAADIVVYDGHAGVGHGFRFGPLNVVMDKLYSFKFGKIRPHVDVPVEKITKGRFLQKLLKRLPWVQDGEFFLKFPFGIPFTWGHAMKDIRIDPMMLRQLLFLDSCESILYYDKLWAALLKRYQQLRAPERFDLLGTATNASSLDGPSAKLNLLRALEEGMNARQLLDALKAGSLGGTQYAPGSKMGITGQGSYSDIYGDHALSSLSEAGAVPEKLRAGTILDNDGASVTFEKRLDQRKSYPLSL